MVWAWGASGSAGSDGFVSVSCNATDCGDGDDSNDLGDSDECGDCGECGDRGGSFDSGPSVLPSGLWPKAASRESVSSESRCTMSPTVPKVDCQFNWATKAAPYLAAGPATSWCDAVIALKALAST
eukprot:CAMPEP_0171130212 /NCGR_PEP_ID=MMETSP0766_2-20121228/120477_1 /TAXON_ID=439317 /ORGANISM="Gambierdiscus australes, Strain CAWD 149" /LENGTH=125 /DNA_ID=CAMNT_0011593451 /DNA_START=42 /DNA_END=415 /DNA_ORIENTATION=+